MNISWPVVLLALGILIAIILVLIVPTPGSRTKAGTPHDERSTPPIIYHDDDRYWTGGIFYNNPDDPALFVPKRLGIGWTINFGRPRGKLILFTLMLLPLLTLILSLLIAGPNPIGCHPSGCYPLP